MGITTKHTYFTGSFEVFRVRLAEIISIRQFRDGFGITRDAKGAKLEAFTMDNPYSWFSIKFIDAILDMEDISLPSRDSPAVEDIMDREDAAENCCGGQSAN